MSQTSAISEAFSQTSSLLSGLLAQIGGNGAPNDIFSSLLSNDGDTATSAQSTSATDAAAGSTASSFSALSSSFTNSPASNTGLIQTLDDVASTMQKVLSTLRQQNNGTSSDGDRNNPQPSQKVEPTSSATPSAASSSTTPGFSTHTQGTGWKNKNQPGNAGNANASAASSDSSSSPSSSSSAATTGTAASDTSSTASASSTDPTASSSSTASADAQTLADIIAQLLALTQVMIKDLQQKQASGGTISDGQTAQASGASSAGTSSATGALLANGAAALSASDLLDLQATAPALSPADSTRGIFELLMQVQKIAQQLSSSKLGAPSATSSMDAPAMSNAGSVSALTSSPLASDLSALATTSSDLTTEISLLDTKIKSILTAVKSQDKEPNPISSTTDIVKAAATVAGSASASEAVDTIAAPPATNATPISASTASTQKQDLSGTWQSQIFAAQGNTTPATGASPTASQVFATSAAIAAAADNNTGRADSDAGSDLLSGGGSAGAQNLLNNTTAAGGTQAAGTYNFASTLSALRATNGGSIGLPSVVDQVVLQMNRSVKSGNDQMSLQLNPADLGKITVKLDFGSDGKVQGTVTADNPQTLGMLQKDSRSLERALQDAGLRADPGSLQFNLGGQGQSSGGNNAGQTASNGPGNADAGLADGTISAGDSAGLADSASAETYYLTPSGVNIQV